MSFRFYFYICYKGSQKIENRKAKIGDYETVFQYYPYKNFDGHGSGKP